MVSLSLDIPTNLTDNPVYDVCSNAGFYSTPHLKNYPVTNLTKIAPILNWRLPTILTYIVQSTLPASAVAIAFCALAVLFLFAFLTWRSVRGCRACCCPACGDKCIASWCPVSPPATRQDIFTGWICITLKIFALLFSLFIIAAACYGVATTKDANQIQGVNLVTDAFDTLDSLMKYLSSIITTSQSLVNQLGVVANATLAFTQVLTSNNVPLGSVENVVQSVADVITKLNKVVLSANTTIVGSYYQNSNSWEDTAQKFWSIVVEIAFILYAVILFFTVLYLVSLLFNYKLGICFMSGMQGFLSILFFALCIALSIGLVALRDSCSQTESLVVSVMGDGSLRKLITYYLDQNSAKFFKPEEDAFLSDNLINQTQIKKGILEPVNQTLNAQTPGQLNAATLKIVTEIVSTLTSAIVKSDEIMGSYSRRGSLLHLVSVPVVQSNYQTTKSYLCCDVPGLIYSMYMGCTILGWFCLVLLWIGSYFLWRMDYVAESSNCCNCDCYRPMNPFASKPKMDQYAADDEETAPPAPQGMIKG